MKKQFTIVLLICSLAIVGCAAKKNATNSSGKNTTSVVTMDVAIKNDRVSIEKISNSDFSIFKIGSDFRIEIFNEVQGVISVFGNSSPEFVYENKENPNKSILKNKWESLYLEWLKGNGTILRIVVDGEGFCTKRGIVVGDSLTRINELYGISEGYRSNDKVEFDLGNAENESMMALVFHLNNNVVNRIEITQGT